MQYFAKLRIAGKLTVIVMGIVLLFAILSGALMLVTLSDIMRASLERRGLSVAAEVAELSSDALQTGNLFALEELIHTEKRNNDFVSYIFLLDTDERVMAHTFPKGMPLHLRELHGAGGAEPEVLRVDTSLGQIQDIRWPIEGGALGAVRVGVSEDALRELLVSNVLKMLGITLVILLLAAVLIFRLSEILTRPLHHLMERAEHISKGHFSGRAITFPATDEIGRLANAMNDMERHLREGAQERSRLLRHIITAQEEERKRIAMELHDESGQTLTALLFSLRALANETDDENMQKALLAIRDETADTLARLRNLAVELRPPALDELGIEAALEKLVADYRRKHAVDIELVCAVETVPGDVESLAVYRIVQECLTNIVRHSHATRAQIRLSAEERIVLYVKDNGDGITQERIRAARRENHMGIYGIAERVRLLAGRMELSAELPEWTTVYRIELRGRGGLTDESDDCG